MCREAGGVDTAGSWARVHPAPAAQPDAIVRNPDPARGLGQPAPNGLQVALRCGSTRTEYRVDAAEEDVGGQGVLTIRDASPNGRPGLSDTEAIRGESIQLQVLLPPFDRAV